jgi:uncharacterized membrane protein YcgQ (UPF0703/DUF1980 family)
MRKFWPCILTLCVLLSGCGAAASEKTVEIKEKMFIAQISDIYVNLKDYAGKKVKYEGIMGYGKDSETGETVYSVFRQSPGCCGRDGVAGLDVIWDNPYPPPDSWVEAAGTLEILAVDYGRQVVRYPRVRLTSLKALEKEGERFVTK